MLPAAGTLLFNRDLKLTRVCGIQIKWWNMRFSFTSMVSAIVTTLHTDGRLDSSPKVKPKHVDGPPRGDAVLQ